MQIRKYVLENVVQELDIPVNAEILTVQIQNGSICIWAIVNPKRLNTQYEKRTFRIIGTGFDFDKKGKKYIGTVQRDKFVWHIFEEI